MNINEKNDYINNEFPNEVKYFKLEGINHNICLPKDKPNIAKICELYVNPKIYKSKMVRTDTGLSNEGQYMTGNKLVVEVLLDEKILYAADEKNQSIFALHYEMLKSINVALPSHINGKRVEDLYKSSRLNIMAYILHNSFKIIDERSVNISVLLFLDIQSC